MRSLVEVASFYQNRFAYQPPYSLKYEEAGKLRLILVIPCYDEEPETTLKSLGQNEFTEKGVLVVLVINHPVGNPRAKKHEEQARRWHKAKLANGVEVKVIEAFDLPKKHAGVGLARKIGMDAALQSFAQSGHDGLIVCLDADCEVSPNYISELLKAERAKVKGLSIYFEHALEKIDNTEIRDRIVSYENWLRYYIRALRWTGYFHAFHTIGSGMAVRASEYARIGGMNKRKAGEDFYFLHKLIPQGGFCDLNTCSVFPSARISERVPFGTGRAMLEMQVGSKNFEQVYHPRIFVDIKDWLELGTAIFKTGMNTWPESVQEAATELGWIAQLEEIRKRSGSEASLNKNFKHWLDGFKMLKLVHFLRDNFYGEQAALSAAGKLFGFQGSSGHDLLMHCRHIDRQPSNDYFYKSEL